MNTKSLIAAFLSLTLQLSFHGVLNHQSFDWRTLQIMGQFTCSTKETQMKNTMNPSNIHQRSFT